MAPRAFPLGRPQVRPRIHFARMPPLGNWRLQIADCRLRRGNARGRVQRPRSGQRAGSHAWSTHRLGEAAPFDRESPGCPDSICNLQSAISNSHRAVEQARCPCRAGSGFFGPARHRAPQLHAISGSLMRLGTLARLAQTSCARQTLLRICKRPYRLLPRAGPPGGSMRPRGSRASGRGARNSRKSRAHSCAARKLSRRL